MPKKRFKTMFVGRAIKKYPNSDIAKEYADDVYDAYDQYDLEWKSVILDFSVNPPRTVAIDGGEPEDQTFNRDLDWIVKELNKVNKENKVL